MEKDNVVNNTATENSQASGGCINLEVASVSQSASVMELLKALARAREQMPQLVFDSTNPHFRNRYASLAAVLNTCLPALAGNEVTLTQLPVTAQAPGHIALITLLTHIGSGQFMASRLELPLQRQDAQGVGSAITYARRYALCAILGLAGEEDDDGNGAARADKREPARANGGAAAGSGNSATANGTRPTATGAAATAATANGAPSPCNDNAAFKDQERQRLYRAVDFHMKAQNLTTPQAKREALSKFLGRKLASISEATDDELKSYIRHEDQIRF